MTEAHVLPMLREAAGGRVGLHHTVHTVGEGETALAARIGPPDALRERAGGEVALAFLPAMGTVRVRLSAAGEETTARGVLERAAGHVRSALGGSVFSEDGRSLEQVVGEMLFGRGLWLATAESCTGGAVVARLTSVPGASRYVRGAVVAYDNAVKERVLGVDPAALRQHGAVSEPVALAMAAGARRMLGADVGLATTGVAGPTGGSDEKPVGTIYIAIDSPAGRRATRHLLTKDREMNIALATMLALDLVRRAVGEV
jgi:nicotinamide-nucleotide amidase